MASYIKDVFLAGELLGEGVEPSWSLGSTITRDITLNRWTAFQNHFVEGWPGFVARHSYDKFWLENQPAFHAYDYGANIEIEVGDALAALPKEARQPPEDDSALGSSDPDPGESTNPSPSTKRNISPRKQPGLGDSTGDNTHTHPALWAGGLQNLLTELNDKYIPDNIKIMSYALAVNINCVNWAAPTQGKKPAWCILADRNAIEREYNKPHDVTIYPMAFNQTYGNFTSACPPAFLSEVLTILQDNLSVENDGADVLYAGYFQGYSNIKRSIRHSPDDLLVSKGIATAAMALSDQDGQSAGVRKKQHQLLERLRGRLTKDDPDASKPFARERRRLETAIAEGEFAYRLEQILSLDVQAVVPHRRTFQTILRPIFQLIRFFLKEVEQYTHIFRCFRPAVFPGILCSYAKLFELAIDDIYARYAARSSDGLGMGLAEAVAAIDRLGRYCFTGASKALMPSVMRSLGTMESILKGAWPYISPQMLDVREVDGAMNTTNWPRADTGRPMLMHIAALAFHYGPDVAASQHALCWLKGIGAPSIRGPDGAMRFLDDLVRKLWIPQMTAFVSRQAVRQRNREKCKSRHILESRDQMRHAMEDWSASESPFAWR